MENMQERFQGLTIDEIKEQLKQECDTMRNDIYVKVFTEEDLIDQRVYLARITHEIYDKEEEKKACIEPLNEEIKDLKESQKEQNELLKQGGIKTEGSIYFFYDREKRMAFGYVTDGTLVISRPMTDQEVQNPELKLVE